MIILPQARGILRGRVFYPLQLRIEPQSALILPGFLFPNNQALLGGQVGLSASAYNLGVRAVLFPTVGMLANAGTMVGGTRASLAGTSALSAGASTTKITTTYNMAGTYSYVIPSGAQSLDIKLAGASGGGGGPYGSPQTQSTAGGDSTMTCAALGMNITARGGGGGATSTGPSSFFGGPGGSATGGNLANVTGSDGSPSTYTATTPPGPPGGSDGLGLGIVGGNGGSLTQASFQGSGGGGPGAAHHQASVAGLAGSVITITIGAHGIGGSAPLGPGANGMDGIAIVTWS